MNDSRQAIARQAARECLEWLEFDNDPFTKGEREKCEQIILAAIDKACKEQADETKACIEMVGGLGERSHEIPWRDLVTGEQPIIGDRFEVSEGVWAVWEGGPKSDTLFSKKRWQRKVERSHEPSAQPQKTHYGEFQR
jgi:hypothetical protein